MKRSAFYRGLAHRLFDGEITAAELVAKEPPEEMDLPLFKSGAGLGDDGPERMAALTKAPGRAQPREV